MISKHVHSLFFNGVDLADFGVHVSGNGTFGAPERDYEVVEVPGKSGSLYIDKKRYKNVSITYDAWIGENLEDNLRSLRSFLLSANGYKRLEDSYHPDEYRMAVYVGPLDVETIMLQAGTFSLDFSCKPQRFLKSGDDPIIKQNSSTTTFTFINRTYNIAKPLIRVYGVGTLSVVTSEDTYNMTISAHSGIPYIDIDCDFCDCHYDNTTNCNRYVVFSDNIFPKFDPGNITIAIGTGITRVDIYPRWFNL